MRGPGLQGSLSLLAGSSSPCQAQCGTPRASFGFWEARAVWGWAGKAGCGAICQLSLFRSCGFL